MRHICEDCKYKSTKREVCLFQDMPLPEEKTCGAWRPDLRKQIEEIQCSIN